MQNQRITHVILGLIVCFLYALVGTLMAWWALTAAAEKRPAGTPTKRPLKPAPSIA